MNRFETTLSRGACRPIDLRTLGGSAGDCSCRPLLFVRRAAVRISHVQKDWSSLRASRHFQHFRTKIGPFFVYPALPAIFCFFHAFIKVRGNYLGVIFCNCLYLSVLVKFYGHCGAAPLEAWANVRSTAWCPRQSNVNGLKRQTTVSCDEQLLHLVSVLIQQGNENDALTCWRA